MSDPRLLSPVPELLSPTRISYNRILFATDFSKYSQAALPYALSIAKKYGSTLYVAHVLSDARSPSLGQGPMGTAKEEAERAMAKVIASLPKVPHEARLLTGDVWLALSELIESEKMELVVLGSHGHSGICRLVLGSVAEQVFRRAPCPVLTVGPSDSVDPKNVAEIHEILYATDLTPESLAAAPYAISLAEENQAHLSLLYVIEHEEPGITPDRFERQLYALIPYRTSLKCQPTALVKYGSPAKQIVDCARGKAADLIVLGLRSIEHHPVAATHAPWDKAQTIVTQSHCPVLTVRA